MKSLRSQACNHDSLSTLNKNDLINNSVKHVILFIKYDLNGRY